MIERVTQQVWNWRWASNLSDTSNTKVTFPNSWKYHISLWSFAAFSSLEIVFPYFLKRVCFSPEDPHKITVLSHNRKVLGAGGWEEQYIISQLKSHGILNMWCEILICSVLLSGKGLNLQFGALSKVLSSRPGGAYKFSQSESVHCRQVAEPGCVSRGRVLTNYVDSFGLNVGNFVQNRKRKTKNLFRVDCSRKAFLPLLMFLELSLRLY